MGHTLDEILHQPESWARTLETVPKAWESFGIDPKTIDEAVFVGCGTSLYIAQSAAHAFMEITGISASAVPGSEVFLSGDGCISRVRNVLVVLISRSGTTSEALLAARWLTEHRQNVTTIGVTCNLDTPLEAACDHCIVLPFATEKSVVMTQSFSTMLLACQVMAAIIAGDSEMMTMLQTLPASFHANQPAIEELAKDVASQTWWDTVITLGLGQNQGLAEEGTLKLKEMTQERCEAYNPLEFRHGPISIVNDKTLIVMLEGNREQAYMDRLHKDLADVGGKVVTVGPAKWDDVEASLNLDGPDNDLARCVLYIPFVQQLGYYRALHLDLDPDRPRNLNQVVVLDGQ